MKYPNKQIMNKILLTGALALAGLLPPVIGQGADQPAPAGDFNRGVKAWSDNCARCHNMRDPKEFRDDQWRVIVMHMRVRAGLTGQDVRDILTFLQGSN